jgi:hypothetical protein
MVSLASLWLPIVVSGVVVFFAAFLAWMALPHHRKDWGRLGNEDRFFEMLRDQGIEPGEYMFPWCHGLEKDEMQTRYKAGPWGTLYVLDAQPNFARNLVLTFLFYLAVSLLAGYVASMSLAEGADAAQVFRVVSVCAMMGYCLGSIPGEIFTGRRLRPMLACFADGVVFALITGGIFAWLWPEGPLTIAV